ncbi:5-aminolevulinate synthase [Streptosporangium carneum]|uniref:5-aminolevulinate synthase n=1 Tax=Streptosporangium carneum TaxID=47481 RepID=UPI0022F2EB05|nr:5-aminolevulinate synthase [Streptosporangium carneum]
MFPRKLEELRRNGLYRSFFPCSHLAAERGHATHGAEKVQVWCSNDYLGLSQHPELVRAQIESTVEHGTGSGGSRNIAGTSATHVELETRLAAWHGKERALIFSSGYVANFETLSTLISAIPDIVVFSDARNHRSLIEGILRTGCRKHVFPHNDLDALERALAEYGDDHPKLIVFESVYSMDGDVSPVGAICDLADRYNALTFVDETHAIGTIGPTGAGVCEELGEHRPTFVQGVFGKAVGTVGGYVAGPDGALDYVRSHAPGFIFTTALPQSSMDATLKGLDLVQEGDALRRRLMDNVRYLKGALRAAGIDFIDAESHLVPVMVPGAERVRRVSRRLLEEHGIYVTPINFPSVPRGTERFRVTVPPYRTPEQIDDFVAALRKSLAPE